MISSSDSDGMAVTPMAVIPMTVTPMAVPPMADGSTDPDSDGRAGGAYHTCAGRCHAARADVGGAGREAGGTLGHLECATSTTP